MNHAETARLLTLAATFDRRTIGDADVHAWQDALDDVPAADAMTVVRAHFRTSRAYLTPVDVREGVAVLRRQRLDAVPPSRVPVPEHLDPDNARAYAEWLRTTTEAIAAGTYRPPPEPAGERRALDVSGVVRALPRTAQDKRRARADLVAAMHEQGEAERARATAALTEMGDQR